jgi:hypothetical protein
MKLISKSSWTSPQTSRNLTTTSCMVF